MHRKTRFVAPENTITVKGLTCDEVLLVKAFAERCTSPLGISVHMDFADKNLVRSMLYCNYASMPSTENARDGLVQFLLQTFTVLSEFHQVVQRLSACTFLHECC